MKRILLSFITTLIISSISFANTYTGTGEGYLDKIKLNVEVEGNEITNITTLSSYDTKYIYNNAFEKLKNAIIETQSLDIDTIVGATNSSRGIIEAVDSALISNNIILKTEVIDTVTPQVISEEVSDLEEFPTIINDIDPSTVQAILEVVTTNNSIEVVEDAVEASTINTVTNSPIVTVDAIIGLTTENIASPLITEATNIITSTTLNNIVTELTTTVTSIVTEVSETDTIDTKVITPVAIDENNDSIPSFDSSTVETEKIETLPVSIDNLSNTLSSDIEDLLKEFN